MVLEDGIRGPKKIDPTIIFTKNLTGASRDSKLNRPIWDKTTFAAAGRY
jgi:hypothetical protein